MLTLKTLQEAVEKLDKEYIRQDMKVVFSPFVPPGSPMKLSVKDKEFWFYHSSFEQEFRRNLPSWMFATKQELIDVSVNDLFKLHY